ncbi:MAG: two-component sensor histidine kinase [Proteobacteria bacterium]|nr:two-component sensor histidine kinase [Pseudomonadota bacterium]
MNSIRRKLLLALIGAMSAVMLLGAAATYKAARDEANDLFDYHLEQIALALRDQTFQGSAEALAGEKNFDFVIRVWDREGLSIYSSRPHRVLPDIARLGYATEETSEGAWRVFALQHLGQTITVAQPMQVRSQLAAAAALRTLIPFGILLPLFALLIWWVVIRELRPLSELARSVAVRTPDSLHPFVENEVPEEVRPLVHSLNDLLSRLEAALLAQRGFIADAAHELRTPLTALQLQTQLVERAASDGERSAALHDLKQGLARSMHTVHQLLTLARQEPGAAEQAVAIVSLTDLVRQVVADHAALAAEKNIDLGAAAIDPAACVSGDGDALSTLLANLLGNAVRFTPAGGRIDVSCGVAGQHPYLEVVDSGPGIPAAERERVFDRFYRQGGDECPGSGLGLAIVKTIANRHGATISLDDAPASGLRVRIDFPAVRAIS